MRAKLLAKCRDLRQQGVVEEVFTRRGNVYVVVGKECWNAKTTLGTPDVTSKTRIRSNKKKQGRS